MRVLIATDAFPPNCGGSGWSTWELARGLRARGHEITVVQPRPGTPAGERTREHDGFPVREIGGFAPNLPFVRNYFKNERLARRLAPALARLAVSVGADIIHGQHVLSAPAAIEAAARTARPSVCTVRDYWPVCYWSDLTIDPADPRPCDGCSAAGMRRGLRARGGRFWPLALPMLPYMRRNLAWKRATLSRADAVIAVSSVIGADLRARAPELASTRLEIIPNPVDMAAVRAHAQAPRPLESPYAVYVGKLAPNKGARWLIDVARASALPWPLVVVGDGPERGALERAARDRGVDARFLGWQTRDAALRWLAHADLVVFPSQGPESLSRVLLEAGALGRAIAAMDTGGTRDILEHGRTALLSRSPSDLARHVAQLAADPGLRVRLGDAARAHVDARFDARRVVERVESLYRELIAARRPA